MAVFLITMAGSPILAKGIEGNIAPESIKPTKLTFTNVTTFKTVDLLTAPPGAVLTYNITFVNLGPTISTNIWLNDTLPPGLTYISDTANILPCYSGRWSDSQRHYYNFTNALISGYSFTLTASIDSGVSDGAILTNWAFMNYTDNVSALMPMISSSASTTVTAPSITVSKVADKASANPGELLNYTIYFNNTGTGTASNVWINDTLPSDVQYFSDSNTTEGGIKTSDYNWTFTNVAPGPHSFQVNVSINSGAANGTLITNQVICEYSPDNVLTQDWTNTTVVAPEADPTSSIDPVSSYWRNTNTIITSAANDTDGTVTQVELFYRNSIDNSSWGIWTSFSVDFTEPWSWDFDFPDGYGYYEFYSIATDNSLNMESAPGTADALAAYDATAPNSTVNSISPYVRTAPTITVSSTAADAFSGVDWVEFYYRYSSDNSSFGSWLLFLNDTTAPWSMSFDFPDGYGYYEFYSISSDIIPNIETIPASADTLCQYTQPPAPFITISKVVDKVSAAPLDYLNYTIYYNNTGSVTANNVMITENLPPGLVYLSAIPPPNIGNNTWNLGSLTQGSGGIITINFQIEPGLVNGTILTNQVICNYDPGNMQTQDWTNTTLIVLPNISPIAIARPDYQEVETVDDVILEGNLSYDLDGDIVSYLWDFGDGTFGTGIFASHQYLALGNYTITLTVIDDRGQTATGTCLVSVIDSTPPDISNVIVSPTLSTNRNSINIFCNVTDNIDVVHVDLTYLHNGTVWISLPMISNIQDVYQTVFGPVNQGFPFYVNATDTSGNTAAYFGTVVVRKARINITHEGLEPEGELKEDSTVWINGTVTVDGEINNTGLFVIALINGEEIGKVAVQVDGTYDLEFPFPSLEDGDNILEIRLVDNVTGETHEIESVILPGGSSPPCFIALFCIIIIGISIAFVFVLEGVKYASILLAMHLYSKLKKSNVLGTYTRCKIHDYIIANPGNHYSSIRRALELTNGSLAYNLHVLEKEWVIKSKIDGIYKRFFPVDMAIPEEGTIYLTEIQKLILNNIENAPGITQKEISSILRISPSTVNYHINKLVDSKLIRMERKGIWVNYYLTTSTNEE